jgi:hypothetical protein
VAPAVRLPPLTKIPVSVVTVTTAATKRFIAVDRHPPDRARP